MIEAVDGTHDGALESWVESANAADTDFPIQNLPFGRFRLPADGLWRPGVAIGDEVLDLGAAGLVGSVGMQELLALPRNAWRELRQRLSRGLRRVSPDASAWRAALLPRRAVELGLPCEIGDFTDFYAGIHHATAVGRLFRPDAPLLPNYKWIPIGYHGRSSSIVPSGVPFRRPHGQLRRSDSPEPFLGPTARLDYELELGIVIGRGNTQGSRVALDAAEDHVAGLTLLNDWSARDVQGWEYQPLGPFLAKNFATTVSPWIVTLQALAPFRRPFSRPVGDPLPLPYLQSDGNTAQGMIAIDLEVWLQTAARRDRALPGVRLSRSSFLDAYWTLAQLVTHHTVGGCNLRTGDLLGTGTLSGPGPAEGGSLLELSEGGKRPLSLPDGETRTFLLDGDEVVLRASCVADGFRRIGFGECRGTVLPAATAPEDGA